MVDYNKRLVEVDEILNYLSEDDLSKIPEDVRKAIKENKDKNYTWYCDETKPLKEQNISRDTIAFLAYLNMEYLLDENQKKLMKQMHELNQKKLEAKKREKYNVNDLFEDSNLKKEKIEVRENIHNNELIEYKEKFFTKLINKIKQFFSKNKMNG